MNLDTKKTQSLESYDNDNEENDVVVIVMNNQFKEILKSVEGPNGVLDPLNLVNSYLRDPMEIPDFNASEPGSVSHFDAELKAMKLHGLKTLAIESMRFNLTAMGVNTKLRIPELRLEGLYDLEGKLLWVPIDGSGKFHMNVKELLFVGQADIQRRPVTEQLFVSDLMLDIRSDDIHIQFDNLFSTGRLSKFSNAILNQLSTLIFNQVKKSLLAELQTDVQTYLNEKLKDVPTEFIHKRSESLFDDLMVKVTQEIKAKGFDPVELPSQSESFRRDLGFVTATGEAKVYNGILYGLSSLVRTGDVIAVYSNDSVTLEANLGFENMTGSYDWKTTLFGGGPAGMAKLNVNAVSCFVKLRQGLRRGDKPVLDEFKVNGIRSIYVDITGLGTWDFIFEFVFNLVSNAFKSSLASSISNPIKNALQAQLDQLPVNFFI